MTINAAFGKGLAYLRSTKNLTQEDFSVVSSRTYTSMLERGLKSPTLDTIDTFAKRLDIHALTLLAYCYASQGEGAPSDLLREAAREADKLGVPARKTKKQRAGKR